MLFGEKPSGCWRQLYCVHRVPALLRYGVGVAEQGIGDVVGGNHYLISVDFGFERAEKERKLFGAEQGGYIAAAHRKS